MAIKPSKKVVAGVLLVLLMAGIWGYSRIGMFMMMARGTGPQSVEVKAMQVVKKDTPINYEFTGKVTSKNEVKIMSKVSGNVVEKFVNGGDTVRKGQPLFRIDNKQYLSSINSAKANLAKAQASLKNTERDVDRYRRLAAVQGVAQQTLDSYLSQAEEQAAVVAASSAALQQAMQDEQDTLIVSPVDGRIDLSDVSVGQFIAAGQTALGTVSSVDPIWVQFSMSETEYLRFARQDQGQLPGSLKDNLKLTLSDGLEYGLSGKIEQIDRGMGDTTGTITLKASFANPQQLLVPGMFAKVTAPGEIRKDAILIPQRAVKEVLEETFVIVVGEGDKAETRKVKMGARIGSLWLVESGITENDRVVVEGVDKAKQGTALKVTMVTQQDLTAPAKK